MHREMSMFPFLIVYKTTFMLLAHTRPVFFFFGLNFNFGRVIEKQIKNSLEPFSLNPS